ncbi:MAG: hypothetical protein K5840_08085 [Eubacterium sp.]|nr:hypothetical protein [Eubacterium sp.]
MGKNAKGSGLKKSEQLDNRKRSAKFRYYLGMVCLIGALINFMIVTITHTVQLVDVVLLVVAILVFAFVYKLYDLEKQGKIFK